jgi:uncharacterized membrane protein
MIGWRLGRREAIVLHGGEGVAQVEMPVTRVEINRVAFDAPWSWLAAGWRDLWTVPRISLLYGFVFAALSALLTLGLMVADLASLVLALAGGFLLIGPVAAVGLYQVSCRLASGEHVTLRTVMALSPQALGQLAFFGASLAFVYFVWLELALLLLMLFLGPRPLPPPSEFVPTLLFTVPGLGLLVTGTIIGGALAAFIFSISVISVPLLMTRRIDAVTAIKSSLEAVSLNPKPMALWAALIAGFITLGICSLFVGLVIGFPLIGHATWHAFRDVVRNGADGYL